MTAEPLADDHAQLAEIMEATVDPVRLARLVCAYYHDLDRAERTDRRLLYLHLGMLGGAIMRLAAERRGSTQ